MEPGVVSGAPTGGGIYVHGARDRSWNYTLDGIDANDSSQGGSNTTSFRVNPDMLDEFKVITGNNTAEYGRNSGGQVAMITRSGSNEFHGNAFWFYRTPRLNANEFQNNLQGLGKAQLEQNIYGGGVGGPVIGRTRPSSSSNSRDCAPAAAPATTPYRLHRTGSPGNPALRQGRTQSARERSRRIGRRHRQSASRRQHRHL